MNLRVRVLTLTICLLATVAFGQGSTAGSLQFQNGGTIPSGGIAYLDYGRPVTADGTITNAALRWLSNSACSGAFRIRFFHPVTATADNFTLVGETPTFSVPSGNTLQFVSFPGIAVQKGDFLSVAQIPANCGGATYSFSSAPGDVVWQISSNFTGGVLSNIQALRRGRRLDAVVSSAPMRLAGVIPVVGSIQGIGAFFRSSLHLVNPCPFDIDGIIVYHPAGIAGSASDPSLTYHLASGGSISYPDITAAFNRSGIGSLDVYTPACVPEVTAYVYNDVGAAGTYGFAEDLVPISSMSTADVQFTVLPIPPDLTNFRVNIGVRTLGTPTTIGGSVRDADGNLKGTIADKPYPANYFEQTSLSAFMGSITPPPGGSILMYVQTGGPAVYYTSTIDNRTNDSSIKMIVAK